MHKSIRFAAKGLATLAVAVGLATAGQGAAYADTSVTVPGCYGVIVIACDPTAEVLSTPTPTLVTWTVPVCAGTCRDVDVPAVELTPGSPGNPRVCVSWKDRNGYTSGPICGDSGIANEVVYEVQRVYDQYCGGYLKGCVYGAQRIIDEICWQTQLCYISTT